MMNYSLEHVSANALSPDDRPIYDCFEIIYFILMSVLGIIIVTATTLHALKRNTNSITQNFSAITNCRRIFHFESTLSDQLSCLNGIRVISTFWIVGYHTYQYVVSQLPKDELSSANAIVSQLSIIEILIPKIKSQIVQSPKKWWMQPLTNGFLPNETFFLMSGLLVTRSLFRKLDRNNCFNPLTFYLHRYIRLTPMYAAIFGFIAIIFYFFVLQI